MALTDQRQPCREPARTGSRPVRQLRPTGIGRSGSCRADSTGAAGRDQTARTCRQRKARRGKIETAARRNALLRWPARLARRQDNGADARGSPMKKRRRFRSRPAFRCRRAVELTPCCVALPCQRDSLARRWGKPWRDKRTACPRRRHRRNEPSQPAMCRRDRFRRWPGRRGGATRSRRPPTRGKAPSLGRFVPVQRCRFPTHAGAGRRHINPTQQRSPARGGSAGRPAAVHVTPGSQRVRLRATRSRATWPS